MANAERLNKQRRAEILSMMPPSGLAENVPWERLWTHLSGRFPLEQDSIHGPAHWRRVETNGLLIARDSGADITAVRLFALFHDCQRENEYTDPGHGHRGANLASSLLGSEFHLDDVRFALLKEACEGHTDIIHHPDPTVGTCWDADRLDLPRVGIIPDPTYLNTALAKELCLGCSL